MAGHVSAAEGALLRGADTVANTRTELTGQLDTIRGQIESTRSSWTGAGALAFTTLMENWNETSNRMVRVLDDFEQSLRGSETRHQATEEAQQQMYSQLSARLN